MTRRIVQILGSLILTTLVGVSGPASVVAQVAGGFGVGTTTPDAALHVFRDDNTAQLHIEETGAGGNQIMLLIEKAVGAGILRYQGQFATWDFTGGNFFTINDASDATIEMQVKKNGDMTVSGDFFAQGGTMLNVPDYVFADDYALMPLSELATFVRKNSHLPNVPSAAEIERDGAVNMTRMQMRLLEKIEELTLYTLQQQETILAQQQTLAEVQARLAAIEGEAAVGSPIVKK